VGISVSTDFWSIESIIMLPNTERGVAWNFIAMWNQLLIRSRASRLPITILANSPASWLMTPARSSLAITFRPEELVEWRCSQGSLCTYAYCFGGPSVNVNLARPDDIHVAARASGLSLSRKSAGTPNRRFRP
jgi:hypothetical protein